MTNLLQIEEQLRQLLPESQHKLIERLASLLSDVVTRAIEGGDAREQFADPTLLTAMRTLIGQDISFGRTGDRISIGDIKQSGPVAIGRESIAISLTLPDLTINVYQSQISAPSPPGVTIDSSSDLMTDVYQRRVWRMINTYTGEVFGGRDTELDVLDTFLDQAAYPYALLLAPTGRGKTALLIRWQKRLEQNNSWTTFFVPISRRFKTARAGQTLYALANEIASFYNDAAPHSLQTSLIPYAIASFLRRDPPDGKRLLLVLDGLDEAIDGWKEWYDIFPEQISTKVRVIVSAREIANKTREDWIKDLYWPADQVYGLTLNKLTKEAVSSILKQNNLEQPASDLSTLDTVYRISEGDPLTVRLLVEALMAGKIKVKDLNRRPPGLEDYIKDWLKEIRKDNDERVYILLMLCAVAQGPLTNFDIQQLYPEKFNYSYSILDNEQAEEAARFIIGDGDEQSGYVFSHPRLRELFLEKFLTGEEKAQLQKRFFKYGHRQYTEYITKLDRPKPSDYLRQFWISHLKETQAWDIMRGVLTDILPVGENEFEQPWANLRFTTEGSHTGYLHDLDILWSWAEEEKDAALGLRCALIASSLKELSNSLPPLLIAGLVSVGLPAQRWPMGTAIEYIYHIQDRLRSERRDSYSDRYSIEGVEEDLGIALNSLAKIGTGHLAEIIVGTKNLILKDVRLRVITELIPYIRESRSPDVWKEAMDTIASLHDRYSSDDDEVYRLLADLAPYVPSEASKYIFNVIHIITNAQKRADTLILFAPRVSLYQLLPALTAAATINDQYKGDELSKAVLREIASHVFVGQPLDACATAFEKLCSLSDERWRGMVLIAFAPNIPLDMMSQALRLASENRAAWWCPHYIAELANNLPVQFLSQAIEIAAGFSTEGGLRSTILRRLTSSLSGLSDQSIYSIILKTASAIIDIEWRSEVLASIVEYLPVNLIEQALTIAYELPDLAVRGLTLAAIIPHLGDVQQKEVLTKVLKEILAVNDAPTIARILLTIIMELPTDSPLATTQQNNLCMLALRAIRAIMSPKAAKKAHGDITENYETQAWYFSLLVPYLPATQRITVYREAIAAMSAVHDDKWCASVLNTTLADLPVEVLPEVYSFAVELNDERLFAKVLTRILPSLSLNGQTQALRDVELRFGVQATEVFIELAPVLPPSLVASAVVLIVQKAYRWWEEESISLERFKLFVTHLEVQDERVFADAISAAHALEDNEKKAEALILLACFLPQGSREKIYMDAISAKKAISNMWRWDQAIRKLVPYLPADLLARELVATFVPGNGLDSWDRERILNAMETRISEVRKTDIYANGLIAALTNLDEQQRVSVLTKIAPYLPPALLVQAIATACTPIKWEDSSRSRSGESDDEDPDDVSVNKEKTEYDYWQLEQKEAAYAQILTEIAPLLPDIQLYDFATDVLTSAYNALSIDLFVVVVFKLAPYLPNEAIRESLMKVSVIPDLAMRARAIVELAHRLPEEEQEEWFRVALSTARSIENLHERIRTVVDVVSHFSPERQKSIYTEEFLATQTIRNETQPGVILEMLVPHLLGHQKQLAVEGLINHTRLISSETERARRLILLAPQLPVELQTEAFAIARSLRNEVQRAEALIAFARTFPAELIPDILAEAQGILDERVRTNLLSSLAPHIPVSALRLMLVVTENISNEVKRARILAMVASKLPLEPKPEHEHGIVEYAFRNGYSKAQPGIAKFGNRFALRPREEETNIFEEMLVRAHNLMNEGARAEVLSALVYVVPANMLLQVFSAVRDLTDGSAKAMVLAAIALSDRVYPKTRGELLAEAVIAATAVPDEEWRAEILCVLLQRASMFEPPEPWISRLNSEELSGKVADAIKTFASSHASARVIVAQAILEMSVSSVTLEAVTRLSAEEQARALEKLAPYMRQSYWSHENLKTGFDIARSIIPDKSRVDALIALAPQLFKEKSLELRNTLLASVSDIADDQERARLLVTFAPYISKKLLPRALSLAGNLRDTAMSVRVQSELVKHFPPFDQIALYTSIFTSVSNIVESDTRFTSLVMLISYLPSALLPSALRAVTEFADENARVEGLVAFATRISNPYLTTDPLRQLLTTVCNFRDRDRTARTLSALPSFLPTSLRLEVLQAARQIKDARHRARVLIATAPHLPVPEQLQAYHEGIAATAEVYDADDRARILLELAPQVSSEALEQAFAVAKTITNTQQRAEVLTKIARLFSDQQRQRRAYADALASASALVDTQEQARVLVVLAPFASFEKQSSICAASIAAAQEITDKWRRDDVLSSLALILCSSRDEKKCSLAIGAAQQIASEETRGDVLAAIALFICIGSQKDVFSQAANAALAIPAISKRVEILALIVPFVSRGIQQLIFESIQAIDDERVRVNAMAQIAPFLDPELEQKIREIISSSTDVHVRMDYAMHRAQMEIRSQPSKKKNMRHKLFQFQPPILDRLIESSLNGSNTDDAQDTPISADLVRIVTHSILKIAVNVHDDWWRTETLRNIAGNLFNISDSNLNAKVFEAALTVPTERSYNSYQDTETRQRASILSALALHLPRPLLSRALVAVREIRDDALRRQTLAAFETEPLVLRRHEDVIEELVKASAVSDDDTRVRMLSEVTVQLVNLVHASPEHEAILLEKWQQCLRVFVQRGRLEFLVDLSAVIQWLVELRIVNDVSDAVIDVAHYWK